MLWRNNLPQKAPRMMEQMEKWTNERFHEWPRLSSARALFVSELSRKLVEFNLHQHAWNWDLIWLHLNLIPIVHW